MFLRLGLSKVKFLHTAPFLSFPLWALHLQTLRLVSLVSLIIIACPVKQHKAVFRTNWQQTKYPRHLDYKMCISEEMKILRPHGGKLQEWVSINRKVTMISLISCTTLTRKDFWSFSVLCATVFLSSNFFWVVFSCNFSMNSNSWCRFCDQIKCFETIFLTVYDILFTFSLLSLYKTRFLL